MARATMADVAARAGVSTMTVSRALNKPGLVAEEVRRRVAAAVEELGYVLDRTAGSLSSSRSGFIAALLPSLDNSNFAATARGLTEAIEAGGLQLLLGYTGYRLEQEEALIEAMLRRRPEGIVVTGGQHSKRARRRLGEAGIPVVETWDLPAHPIDSVVGFSNAGAIGTLVRHLAAKGYREIGFIGGAGRDDARGADRRRGYDEAVAALGLPEGRIVAHGEPPISMRQGAEAIVRLCERWPGVDAAVCVSDLSAFGAIMECRRRGWVVPGRIAIAGFGDFEVAAWSHPRITTVAIDCHAIGRHAGVHLLRAIDARRNGQTAAPETISIPFRILEREST